MSRRDPVTNQLLTPGQVAELFGVDTQTVARWARAGKLHATRTLGGHRRFLASEVHEILGQMPRQRFMPSPPPAGE